MPFYDEITDIYLFQLAKTKRECVWHFFFVCLCWGRGVYVQHYKWHLIADAVLYHMRITLDVPLSFILLRKYKSRFDQQTLLVAATSSEVYPFVL